MRKLLFVTQNPFLPDSSGGAQKSASYLFDSLIQRGWQVQVICASSIKTDRFKNSAFKSILNMNFPKRFTLDMELGYPCWRHIIKYSSQEHWLYFLENRLSEYNPDVVLGDSSPNCPLLAYAISRKFECFYIGRNINITQSTSILPNDLNFLANSPFVASIISQIMNQDVKVILPFVDVNTYKIEERIGKYITFINPVPEKGVQIAIQVAKALPNERFLFVKGKWSHMRQEQMENHLKPAYKLPNVEIWENQSDMREVYKVADIMLVPSQFIETFGRVILEAQINHIPVVAGDVGGIPYTLGKGGILVSPKHKPEGYIKAIEKLRLNQDYYSEISKLAFENSNRPEFNPQFQVDRFVRFVEEKLSSRV
jgi:glycosyltransferase involved in cell wall biosynthesis